MDIAAAQVLSPEITTALPRPGAGTPSVDFGGMIADSAIAAAAVAVRSPGPVVTRAAGAGLATIVPPAMDGTEPVQTLSAAATPQPRAPLDEGTTAVPIALPEPLPSPATPPEDATAATDPAPQPETPAPTADAARVPDARSKPAEPTKPATVFRTLADPVATPARFGANDVPASDDEKSEGVNTDDEAAADDDSVVDRRDRSDADEATVSAPATPVPDQPPAPAPVATLAIAAAPAVTIRSDRTVREEPGMAAGSGTTNAVILPSEAAPLSPSRASEKDPGAERLRDDNGPTTPSAFEARLGVEQASPASATPAPTSSSSAAPANPDTAVTATAVPGRLGHDIGVHIARHVADGREHLTVRLNPANMGRVDIRLSFSDEGHLHAAVSADNPASLDLLRREAPDLGRALTDAGISTDLSSFSFDRSDSHASGFGQSSYPQQDRRGFAAGSPAFAATSQDEPAALAFRPERSATRINLMA